MHPMHCNSVTSVNQNRSHAVHMLVLWKFRTKMPSPSTSLILFLFPSLLLMPLLLLPSPLHLLHAFPPTLPFPPHPLRRARGLWWRQTHPNQSPLPCTFTIHFFIWNRKELAQSWGWCMTRCGGPLTDSRWWMHHRLHCRRWVLSSPSSRPDHLGPLHSPFL